MDKKVSKKAKSKTPRETYSLDAESLKIIQDEIDSAENESDYKPSKSAVVRKALKLLKAANERAKAIRDAAKDRSDKAKE